MPTVLKIMFYRGEGIDAMRAYNAYRSSDAMQFAQAAWTYGRSYTISSEDISNGSIGTKSFQIPKSCEESKSCESFQRCNN